MRKLILLGVVVALSGCAAELKNMNETLRQANGALAGRGPVASTASTNTAAPVTLGDVTGYQPTVMVPQPADLCDGAAFRDGVRVGYTNSWNQQVRDRAMVTKLAAAQNKRDAKLQANAELYRSKIISTTNLPLETSYQMQVAVGATNCKHDSFAKGKTGGLQAAIQDYQALVQTEAK